MVEGKFLLLPALTLLSASAVLLRKGWRGKQWQHRVMVVAAWLCLVAGAACWSAVEGAEFGITLSLVVWSLLGCLVVALGAKWRPANERTKTRGANGPSALGDTGLGQKTLTFFVAGPLAMVCTALVSIVLVRLLPTSVGGQWVVAAFLFPTLWGITAFWVCASLRFRREALIVTSGGLVSGVCLLLSFFSYVSI